MIRDLEEGTSYIHKGGNPSSNVVENEIIRLGTTYGLASKYTSFIAVEERSVEEKIANGQYQPVYYQQAYILQPQSVMQPQLNFHQQQSRTRKSSQGPISFGAPPPAAAGAPPPAARVAPGAPPALFAMSKSSAMPKMKKKEMKEKDSRKTRERVEYKEEEDSSEEDFLQEKEEEKMDVEVPQSEKEEKAKKVIRTSLPQDKRSIMVNLLNQQSFQGFFSLSESLFSLVGVPSQNLQSADSLSTSISEKDIRDKVLATLLAITFFEKSLSDLSDEWELAVNKAKKWLASLRISNLAEISNFVASMIK